MPRSGAASDTFASHSRRYESLTGAAVMAVLILVASCGSQKERKSSLTGAANNDGYSLLYELVSKQKDVDKLLLVKAESPDVNTLIKKIAAASGNAAGRLDGFARADPGLNLKLESLPAAEQRARKAIERSRAKTLLFARGIDFELHLLLSQAESMSYGEELAATVAEEEPQAERKRYLTHLSEELGQLRKEVLETLKSRWHSPEQGTRTEDRSQASLTLKA